MLGKRRSSKQDFADSPDPMLNGEHRLVPQCQTVFDVGARTDDYLVRLNRNCKFHLFEPMAESFAELQRKTLDDANVTIVNTALGNEHGDLQIYPDTQSIHKRPHGSSEPMEIKIQTLDDYCHNAGIETIDFMKIDVEGYELDVLRGGQQMIQERVRTIQFEYGGTYEEVGISLEDVFLFLGERWTMYRVLPSGLVEVPRYTERLENYQYANFVASRVALDECLAPSSSLLGRITSSWRRKAA